MAMPMISIPLNPGEGNTVYFNNDLLPHLSEVRRLIDEQDESLQEFNKKLRAVTYIMQVYHALRVTDIYGAIPYSEAGKGRFESKLDPVYDQQESLYDIFLSELDEAMQVLSESLAEEVDLSQEDFIYRGDWSKWIKCANAIKLRIALRLESQDLAQAKTIISDVVSDGRIFESRDDEFTYFISDNWTGTGGATMDWKGRLWAAKPMVDFMKKTIDPRIRIFYEPNGFHQATLDDFVTTGNDLPPLVDIVNDNQVLYTAADGEPIYGYRYIGGAASRLDPNVADYSYIDNPTSVGLNATQLSKYNQRLLMNTRKNYGDGTGEGAYVDVLISYAEVSLMMSEFILKGYTSGDASEWYEKGIRASMETYDFIAEEGQLDFKIAEKSYPRVAISDAEIEAYLLTPEVVFDGANDLEKVYIQQHLNFYRLPDEGLVLGRRTGYPRFGSSLLAREQIDNPELKFPRRMPTPDPGDLNRENWSSSNSTQGFSNLDESPEVLNAQRMWWDLNNPELGEGN